MKKNILVFISGFLFSVGLFISGMTNPAKIISFLDITGNWDPSLLLVMIAAVVPTFFLYRFAFQNQKPWFDVKFYIPEKKSLDRNLIIGSVLFGIGWGLSGICPGPGVANVLAGQMYFLTFVLSMFVGMLLIRRK